MKSSSCQSWYFVWVFEYEDAELIVPKLVLCLGFWIRGCRAHPAKVGTLSGVLEDAEFILSKLVPFLGFWIQRCRAHPDNVGTLCGFLDMRMQSLYCQSW